MRIAKIGNQFPVQNNNNKDNVHFQANIEDLKRVYRELPPQKSNLKRLLGELIVFFKAMQHQLPEIYKHQPEKTSINYKIGDLSTVPDAAKSILVLNSKFNRFADIDRRFNTQIPQDGTFGTAFSNFLKAHGVKNPEIITIEKA